MPLLYDPTRDSDRGSDCELSLSSSNCSSDTSSFGRQSCDSANSVTTPGSGGNRSSATTAGSSASIDGGSGSSSFSGGSLQRTASSLSLLQDLQAEDDLEPPDAPPSNSPTSAKSRLRRKFSFRRSSSSDASHSHTPAVHGRTNTSVSRKTCSRCASTRTHVHHHSHSTSTSSAGSSPHHADNEQGSPTRTHTHTHSHTHTHTFAFPTGSSRHGHTWPPALADKGKENSAASGKSRSLTSKGRSKSKDGAGRTTRSERKTSFSLHRKVRGLFLKKRLNRSEKGPRMERATSAPVPSTPSNDLHPGSTTSSASHTHTRTHVHTCSLHTPTTTPAPAEPETAHAIGDEPTLTLSGSAVQLPAPGSEKRNPDEHDVCALAAADDPFATATQYCCKQSSAESDLFPIQEGKLMLARNPPDAFPSSYCLALRCSRFEEHLIHQWFLQTCYDAEGHHSHFESPCGPTGRVPRSPGSSHTLSHTHTHTHTQHTVPDSASGAHEALLDGPGSLDGHRDSSAASSDSEHVCPDCEVAQASGSGCGCDSSSDSSHRSQGSHSHSAGGVGGHHDAPAVINFMANPDYVYTLDENFTFEHPPLG